MSGTLICGRHTASDTIVPVEVNADGTLEMTAEIDSSALAKESTLDSFRTENASNLGALATALDDGTQITKCMGSETGLVGGSQKQVRVDGNGRLSIDINSGIPTKTDGTAGHSPATGIGLIGFEGATARAVACDSSGNLQVDIVNTANVKFEDISSSLNSGTNDDPANSLAVGLRGRTDPADKNTETFCLVDSQGHLQVDVLSGGGGSSSSTQTSESTSVAHNTLTVLGDNTNDWIDTNGGNKFVIIVQSTSSAGGAQISIEWSDVTGFTAGNVSVVNGFVAGAADATPASLSAVTRADGTSLTNQRVFNYETIPARYCRVTIKQSSGGALTYVAKSYLSP